MELHLEVILGFAIAAGVGLYYVMGGTSHCNIALSGWSGVGTSTLTLLLSRLLGRRYVYLGAVFRDLGSRLGFAEEGMDRPAADAYLEPIIGRTVDNYVDFVLLNGDGVILESDLSAFRLGTHERVVSVFLKAEMETRLERIAYDNREGGAEALAERDRVLREKYLELWGIDIFDQELINEKYNLVLNTSDFSILEKVLAVLAYFRHDGRLSYDWDEIERRSSTEVENYLRYGKSEYRNALERDGLVMGAKEIEADIAANFAEDVASFPEDVRTLFG